MSSLSASKLSLRWSVTTRTLRRWRQNNKGPPFFIVVNRVFYYLSDIEAFEKNHFHASTKTSKGDSI